MKLDLADPRAAKALVIAADAGQWLKCRTGDGRKLYGIPSQSKRGMYHMANTQQCDCPDFTRWHRGDCKHVLAVRLHVALVNAQKRSVRRKTAKVTTQSDERFWGRFAD